MSDKDDLPSMGPYKDGKPLHDALPYAGNVVSLDFAVQQLNEARAALDNVQAENARLRALVDTNYEADPLDHEVDFSKLRRIGRIGELANMVEEHERVIAENTRLRAALANSLAACVYCTLPVEEWDRCESGFPGCARMDDALGCPHLLTAMGLTENERQHQELWARLEALLERWAVDIAELNDAVLNERIAHQVAVQYIEELREAMTPSEQADDHDPDAPF